MHQSTAGRWLSGCHTRRKALLGASHNSTAPTTRGGCAQILHDLLALLEG